MLSDRQFSIVTFVRFALSVTITFLKLNSFEKGDHKLLTGIFENYFGYNFSAL